MSRRYNYFCEGGGPGFERRSIKLNDKKIAEVKADFYSDEALAEIFTELGDLLELEGELRRAARYAYIPPSVTAILARLHRFRFDSMYLRQ